MSRRKEIALVTAGILAGIAVSGPAAQATAGLMANPSNQKFYLDDQRISLTAYEIGGSNYVKLRDIGEAVDFGVTYDTAANTVTIHPDMPYEMTATVPAISRPTLPTLSKNTDGSINVPQDGSQYVPQAGDVIRCDDGTNYTTVALQNGVDVKTVSSMLGHYDAGFTLRTYTHATRQVQNQAAETMGNFMAQVM